MGNSKIKDICSRKGVGMTSTTNTLLVVAMVAFVCSMSMIVVDAQSTCESLGIKISKFNLPTNVVQGNPDVQFTSTGIIISKGGAVFRSSDGGSSWANQLPLMPFSNQIVPPATLSGVKYTVGSTVDQDLIYFIGNSGYMWVTKDGGASYSVIDYFINAYLPVFPFVIPSPTDANQIIVVARERKTRVPTLLLSLDAGKSWDVVDSNVQAITWAKANSGVVYSKCPINFQSSYECDLYIATDNGQNRTKVLSHSVNFYANLGSLVAAQSSNSSARVHLYLSQDGFTWSQLQLPGVDVFENRWELVMGLEGIQSHWIVLYDNETQHFPTATLYVPDSRPNYMTLSLENLRVTGGSVNINVPKGLSNVVVYTNTIHNLGPSLKPEIVTRVSFNNGGTWTKFLTSPDCQPSNCLLQIDDSDSTTKITIGSPGVFLTDGNLGSILGLTPKKTFISTDYGDTWRQLLDKPSEFAFADQGALTVWIANSIQTNAMQFSWAIGRSDATVTCNFTTDPISVTDVVSIDDDGQLGTTVLIYGTQNVGGVLKGLIFTADFSDYPVHQCKNVQNADGNGESDYEYSQPIDPNGEDCILGRSTVYIRKKPTSACYDPGNYNILHHVERCGCVEEDYECDYCYERDSDGKCVLQKDCSKFSLKGLCTNGYSIIPGDECDDDKGLNRIPNCSTSGGIIVAMLFIIAIIITGIVLYKKNDKFRAYCHHIIRTVRGYHSTNINLDAYSAVNQDEVDDEENNLFDDNLAHNLERDEEEEEDETTLHTPTQSAESDDPPTTPPTENSNSLLNL